MDSIMAKWEELPIADRAQYMRVAVQNGYRDIRSIREAYNRYAEGGNLFKTGGPKGTKKVGPTYNPQTKTWTNSKGQNITGKSFKGQYGTTTYLDSGAVDLDASAVSGKYNDHRWRYASNAPRVYIGGTTNEARQKYFDTDTELTNAVKNMAKQYGISPNVLASRIAKEGPIDEAIRNYNNTNGYLQRGNMIGPIWGLDDMGTWITNGTVKLRKGLIVDTDYEMENEKGRTTYSVSSDNYMNGVELTAIALKYFKDQMRQQYPKASEAQLEQYATAAFNTGMAGATKLINQGKIQNAYRPFINIRKEGGEIDLVITQYDQNGGYDPLHSNGGKLLTKSNYHAYGGFKRRMMTRL